ncbi:MAG: T9SS type A sorting domain-containing protein [Cytophagia bacterium]|nr:T9SS type A sorting domain-containing protein [Cytophagia bacterium]
MDFSSTAISLCSNGNIIAIGSPNNKNGSLLRAGMVRVYEWDGSSWIQRGKDLKGNKELDLFGNSVCLDQDGNTLVIGADDLNVSNGGRGYVDVYSWNAIEWIHKGSTILGEQEFDQAGFVSINADGNVIAIGSEDNDGTGDHAGHVRVFSINWVGLEEENDFSGINVFPNPANQDIQIDFDDNLSLVGMKVIDINGKMIYSNAYSNIKSINYKLEGESGIYFLELTNKEGKLARFKVIKE